MKTHSNKRAMRATCSSGTQLHSTATKLLLQSVCALVCVCVLSKDILLNRFSLVLWLISLRVCVSLFRIARSKHRGALLIAFRCCMYSLNYILFATILSVSATHTQKRAELTLESNRRPYMTQTHTLEWFVFIFEMLKWRRKKLNRYSAVWCGTGECKFVRNNIFCPCIGGAGEGERQTLSKRNWKELVGGVVSKDKQMHNGLTSICRSDEKLI